MGTGFRRTLKTGVGRGEEGEAADVGENVGEDVGGGTTREGDEAWATGALIRSVGPVTTTEPVRVGTGARRRRLCDRDASTCAAWPSTSSDCSVARRVGVTMRCSAGRSAVAVRIAASAFLTTCRCV